MRKKLITALILLFAFAHLRAQNQFNDYVGLSSFQISPQIAGFVPTSNGGIVNFVSAHVLLDSLGFVRECYQYFDSSMGVGFYSTSVLLGNGILYSMGYNFAGNLFLLKSDQVGNPIDAYVFSSMYVSGGDAIPLSDTTFAIYSGRQIVTFDSDCNVLQRVEFLPDSGYSFQPVSFCNTPDKGFVITGRMQPGWDMGIVKIDSLGNFAWAKRYEFGLTLQCFDITVGADGNYYAIGEIHDGSGWVDSYLLKTDTAGNVILLKTYGDSLYTRTEKIIALSDSGLLLGGIHYYNAIGPSDKNVLLFRTDLDGNVEWSNTYGLRSQWAIEYGEALVDFDLVSDTVVTVTAGLGPGFPGRGWIFSESTFGNNQDLCTRIPVIYTSTTPSYIVSPWTGTTTHLLPNRQVLAPFKDSLSASSLDQCNFVGIPEVSASKLVVVFPNPAEQQVTFQFTEAWSQGVLQIFSSFGQLVYSQELQNENTIVLNCSEWDSGVYVYSIYSSSGFRHYGKVIKL